MTMRIFSELYLISCSMMIHSAVGVVSCSFMVSVRSERINLETKLWFCIFPLAVKQVFVLQNENKYKS
jgi:hypothetical protein